MLIDVVSKLAPVARLTPPCESAFLLNLRIDKVGADGQRIATDLV